jgi:hypothetical protein
LLIDPLHQPGGFVNGELRLSQRMAVEKKPNPVDARSKGILREPVGVLFLKDLFHGSVRVGFIALSTIP